MIDIIKLNIFTADAEETKKLIAEGVDVNYTNADGMTALFHAGYEKSQVLINAGADVNHRAHDGSTPIFLADKKTTRLLLEHGADVNVITNENAVFNCYPGVKSSLLYMERIRVMKALMKSELNRHGFHRLDCTHFGR